MFGRPYEFVGPTLVILTIVNGLTYENMESFVGGSLFWLGIGLCRARWNSEENRSKHLQGPIQVVRVPYLVTHKS